MELLDDGMCFVCGKKNKDGLGLTFNLDGDVLRTSFTPQKKHQGYTNIVHGGIIAIVLDEMLINLPWQLGMKAVTAEFTVRLKQPVSVGEPLEFWSKIEKQKGRFIQTYAEAKKTDGTIVAAARGKCIKQ